tara:strand:- start:207 stop:992 length:786 start_codon:yes stop_codon:yes gene_type:complete
MYQYTDDEMKFIDILNKNTYEMNNDMWIELGLNKVEGNASEYSKKENQKQQLQLYDAWKIKETGNIDFYGLFNGVPNSYVLGEKHRRRLYAYFYSDVFLSSLPVQLEGYLKMKKEEDWKKEWELNQLKYEFETYEGGQRYDQNYLGYLFTDNYKAADIMGIYGINIEDVVNTWALKEDLLLDWDLPYLQKYDPSITESDMIYLKTKILFDLFPIFGSLSYRTMNKKMYELQKYSMFDKNFNIKYIKDIKTKKNEEGKDKRE